MSRDTSAVDAFFSGFYANPSPTLAAETLRQFMVLNTERRPQAILHFIRAGQLFPDVRQKYSELVATVPEIANDVNQVLRNIDEMSFPDPATMKIETPNDLDFLWGEFLLSGDLAPVVRIAAAVQGEDLLRARLVKWAASSPRFFGTSKRQRQTEKLIREGFRFNDLSAKIDLDLVLWKMMASGYQANAELPFKLDEELVRHLSVKGSACWSLQSNGQQHASVGELYARLKLDVPSFI